MSTEPEDKQLAHRPAGAIATTEPQNMLQMVMRAAGDPSIDADKLEKLLRIGKELEQDKRAAEWAAAFQAAKFEIDEYRITKNGKIVYPGKPGKEDSVVRFIRYDDIADAVKPILRKNGLASSYTFRHEATPPKTICVMTITHANGFERVFESVPLPMVDDSGGKNAVQGAGSVMTYGRRYATCAAFDIVADGEDDDGNLGRDLAKPITAEEFETIDNILRSCEDKAPNTRKLFTAWMLKELKTANPKELMQGRQLKAVMTVLEGKQRQLGLKK